MRVAILLAAGRSRRFAGANKLLTRAAGRPIVGRALAMALAAPVGRVIVVVGHDHARVAAAVRGSRVTVVRARGYREGVAASLRAGLGALRPIERELFVFLGDMPAVPPSLPGRLARALRPEIAAARPRGRAGPDHPVLLRRPDPATIARLSGDRGLGGLIGGPVRLIAIRANAGDIDTRRDLARLRRTFAPADC